MKIDFSKVIKDLDGTAFKAKDKPDSPEREMTLKDAALQALCSPLEADRGMDGKQAFERYELARKINAGGEIEIDPAQVALIQDRLPKVYPVLIAGAAYEMLRG